MSVLEAQIWKILGKKGKEIPTLPVDSGKISNPLVSYSIRFLVFFLCNSFPHLMSNNWSQVSQNCLSFMQNVVSCLVKGYFSGFCMFLLGLLVCWPHFCKSLYKYCMISFNEVWCKMLHQSHISQSVPC